ncbi:head-tail connector protein [uncultured Clostridium sp.]|uniref:head-tail connector protein n=1 Tax=uncultured Clostridium sp. TaxID=59620 RepID=UPI0026062B87|nr:head-tail connector protein [uncultured Clostridium sp.]
MLLDKIKMRLRISHNKLDIEINDLIEAAKLDLKISGVNKIIEHDPLIIQAIKVYCKANFELDNKDSEKYLKSYNLLKEHLALCGDYK